MNYDYVIVGGGSAGSTLASRLSADPSVTVCLLEAGGDGKGALIRAPAGVALMVSGRPKINNWAFDTVPQAGLNGRRGFQPRGKALGGSSAINGMLYVRGHRSDYDDWAALGCKGWSYADVLPYFLRAEANQNGADAWHGDSGPLHVSNQRNPRSITGAFIRAAGELQHRENADFNGAEQEGVGLYQVTQFHGPAKAGERCSAAAAYLHPNEGRANLTIVTRAHATKVEFDGKRAKSVRYRIGGEEKSVAANREIILCGGAFNSPQLLQLSGVGRPQDLRRHGIEVVHELNGVGQNLRDHLDFLLFYKSKDSDLTGLGAGGDGQDGEGYFPLAQGRLRPDRLPGARGRRLFEDGPVSPEARHPASFLRGDRRRPFAQAASRLRVFLRRLRAAAEIGRRKCSCRAPIQWPRRASIRNSSPTQTTSGCW